jgi:hypothetical protein
MNRLFKIISLCSILISFTIFAGTIDPNTPDSKYIEYGSKFEYVYKICGTYKDDTKFCASAVAIDDHWLLTAAHVVKDAKLCNVSNNDIAYEIDDIIIHKDFETSFGVADIAICHTSKKLGLKFYPALYENTDEVGNICSISGYGITGTFSSKTKISDGKRRSGSNVIDYIEKDLLICSPSKNKDKTELEFLICHGDSGGGLFIGNKLAGINSCVMSKNRSPNSIYGDESGHTRISKFVPWIKSIQNRQNKP